MLRVKNNIGKIVEYIGLSDKDHPDIDKHDGEVKFHNGYKKRERNCR